jgi:hypothetical protein
MKVAASLVAAIFLGGVGMFLYLMCQESDNLFPLIIAYVLCWPVVLIGRLTNGSWRIYNFDPIIGPRFGWLAMSLYYYLWASLISALRLVRSKRLGSEG